MAYILVLDDDHLFAELLTIFLTNHGFDVASAHSAAEALPIVEGEHPLFAAAIDYEIGVESNGLAVAAMVAESHPSAKVVLISGHSREFVLPEDSDTVFLEKPFHPERLIELFNT